MDLKIHLRTEYYRGINGDEVNMKGYLCDKCETQPLTEREYTNNFMMNGCRYCDECRTFMKLQKYTCVYCWNSWTQRNERIVPKECECGGLVVWLK